MPVQALKDRIHEQELLQAQTHAHGQAHVVLDQTTVKFTLFNKDLVVYKSEKSLMTKKTLHYGKTWQV